MPANELCRVLDFGCGAGAFVHVACRSGFAAYGADPALQAVPRAARPRLLDTVAEARQAAGGPFDAAVCNFALEHMNDIVEPLAALRAVLRAGAPLVVRVPDYRYTRRFPVTGRLQRRSGEHRFFFTPEALGTVLARAGFEDVLHTAPLSTVSLITPAASLFARLDPEKDGTMPGIGRLCALGAATAFLLPLVLWRRARGSDAVLETWSVRAG